MRTSLSRQTSARGRMLQARDVTRRIPSPQDGQRSMVPPGAAGPPSSHVSPHHGPTPGASGHALSASSGSVPLSDHTAVHTLTDHQSSVGPSVAGEATRPLDTPGMPSSATPPRSPPHGGVLWPKKSSNAVLPTQQGGFGAAAAPQRGGSRGHLRES